jgi:hypothetical protein
MNSFSKTVPLTGENYRMCNNTMHCMLKGKIWDIRIWDSKNCTTVYSKISQYSALKSYTNKY